MEPMTRVTVTATVSGPESRRLELSSLARHLGYFGQSSGYATSVGARELPEQLLSGV
jgi:hypothetical protein